MRTRVATLGGSLLRPEVEDRHEWLIGLCKAVNDVISSGYKLALVIGGGAEQLSEFNGDELFSFRRITLAPIFIVIGYVIIAVSIMKKPKEFNSQEIENPKKVK